MAIRQFPQLHTNPVYVLVGASRFARHAKARSGRSACIDQLWRVRERRIAPAERADAERAYDEARAIYRRIAAESPSQR